MHGSIPHLILVGQRLKMFLKQTSRRVCSNVSKGLPDVLLEKKKCCSKKTRIVGMAFLRNGGSHSLLLSTLLLPFKWSVMHVVVLDQQPHSEDILRRKKRKVWKQQKKGSLLPNRSIERTYETKHTKNRFQEFSPVVSFFFFP